MPIADEKVRKQKRRREDGDGVNDQSKRISTAEEEGRDHQKQIKLEYEEKSKPAPGCSFWEMRRRKLSKLRRSRKRSQPTKDSKGLAPFTYTVKL